MNYSTEQEDYLMTTPYTKKIQKKFTCDNRMKFFSYE